MRQNNTGIRIAIPATGMRLYGASSMSWSGTVRWAYCSMMFSGLPGVAETRAMELDRPEAQTPKPVYPAAAR